MPCGPDVPYRPDVLNANDVRAIIRDELSGASREPVPDRGTTYLTRYLCGVLTILKNHKLDVATIKRVEKQIDGIESGSLQGWWERHQELDLSRKDDE